MNACCLNILCLMVDWGGKRARGGVGGWKSTGYRQRQQRNKLALSICIADRVCFRITQLFVSPLSHDPSFRTHPTEPARLMLTLFALLHRELLSNVGVKSTPTDTLVTGSRASLNKLLVMRLHASRLPSLALGDNKTNIPTIICRGERGPRFPISMPSFTHAITNMC